VISFSLKRGDFMPEGRLKISPAALRFERAFIGSFKEVIRVSRAWGRAASQRGQGMVEYALILVLVSIVVIVILLTMGNQIQNVFSNVVAALG